MHHYQLNDSGPSMANKNVIIIGSGIAGMGTAIRLAVQGFSVSVYEKNSHPGGKISTFEKMNYTFDEGPSLFTQPQNVEELFKLAGVPIKEYFTYEAVPLSCKYFFRDGLSIDAWTDAARFDDELHEKLSELPGAVRTYLSRSGKLYENIGQVFLHHSLHKRDAWINSKVFKALRAVRYPYLFSTLDHFNRRQFSSPEAIQLFNRYATYNGSNPYLAPAMLSLIPHLEMNQGTFYPHGGMISITNSLYNLAKLKGVEFHFNSPVQRIINHEGRVKGVVVNGQNLGAEIVISNGDIYFTAKELLRDDGWSKKLLRQERSSSAVIFYWGINREFPELHLHNIFFSRDYKTEFESIFKKGNLTTDPTIYINITKKMEDSMAPSGKENWFVMVNAPANTGQDWKELKETLRSNVIGILNRALGVDMEQLIETEQTADPVSIEKQTGSYRGSLYGTSSNSKLAAFFRPANFSSTIKGLYFCGGSVHPGGGIPLCLQSASIVAALIAKAEKKKK